MQINSDIEGVKNVWYYTKKGIVFLTAGATDFGAGAIAGALTGGTTSGPVGAMAVRAILEDLLGMGSG